MHCTCLLLNPSTYCALHQLILNFFLFKNPIKSLNLLCISGRAASGTSSCTRTSSCGTSTRPASSLSLRGGSSAIALNHCGYDGTNTMMTGGCDGTTSDSYERSNTFGTMLDEYNGSSGTMVDGYDGSNPMATMADGYNGSNPMATMGEGCIGSNPMATTADGYSGSNPMEICQRGSPTSPPPSLSPPTQPAAESGCEELGKHF